MLCLEVIVVENGTTVSLKPKYTVYHSGKQKTA